MKKYIYILLIIIIILISWFYFEEIKIFFKNNNIIENKNTDIKLKPRDNEQIYFGAFPDFGGDEEQVTTQKVQDFEKLVGKKITWAMFSQNWGKTDGLKFPAQKIAEIRKAGVIPYVRFMPWGSLEKGCQDQEFSLEKIIAGNFDKQLKIWAQEAKKNKEMILIDFAVEANGNWFPWSGVCHQNKPEIFQNAYRHIIDIFKQEKVNNVTWFFHVDINSVPNKFWNQPKNYYPGDDYIDWVGISIYGPQNEGEDYWDNFSQILEEKYQSILNITQEKPFAVLEFGVTDHNKNGSKSKWLEDAFQTIKNNKYIPFQAIAYWHENWEEEDNVYALIRVDSSKESLETFQKEIELKKFVGKKIITKEKKWYQPEVGITWQWQLAGDLNTSYQVDLYDIDLVETSQEEITKLQKKGSKVLCYFNAGAYEPYRPDSQKFPTEVLGKVMEGWEDEKWLDIAHFEKFADIMEARLDLAVQKGCDGVEPDNIDAYDNDSGFILTYQDQLKYNRWLVKEAHQRGLAIALKNDLNQVFDLMNDFDLAINEECFEYEECDKLLPFIKLNKPVLGVEYNLEKKDFCPQAQEMKFSWMRMDEDLNGWRDACDKKIVNSGEKMNVSIPRYYFDKDENDFIFEFVNYKVPKTEAVLHATLEKLFELRGGDSDGSWNGLKFKSVSINNKNKATVKLVGSWYPVGDMSGMYFSREIDMAVFQYKHIKEIEVLLNNKIFDWCIDDVSDGESGCPEKQMLWKHIRK